MWVWDEEKIWVPDGNRTHIPVGCSNHWATGRLMASIGHNYWVNMTYARIWLVYGRSWIRFPSGTQIFSLSHARDMLNIPSFLISSPSLKFTIFLYLSPTCLYMPCIGHFDIANPSSMQDACHHGLSKYDLCLPVAQWLERPVYGRSWVRFPLENQIFSLSHARNMLNIPSFLRVT